MATGDPSPALVTSIMIWGVSLVGSGRGPWSGVSCSWVPRLVAFGKSCPSLAKRPPSTRGRGEPMTTRICVDGTVLATEPIPGPRIPQLWRRVKRRAHSRLFQGAWRSLGNGQCAAQMVCHEGVPCGLQMEEVRGAEAGSPLCGQSRRHQPSGGSDRNAGRRRKEATQSPRAASCQPPGSGFPTQLSSWPLCL